MTPLPLKVHEVKFSHAWVRTRFPFRYGIASMTTAPHVLVRAEVECGGKFYTGWSAETWVPKWFTKNPATTYAQDLPDMCRTLEHAAAAAMEPREPAILFDWWRALYAAQSDPLSPRSRSRDQRHPEKANSYQKKIVVASAPDSNYKSSQQNR